MSDRQWNPGAVKEDELLARIGVSDHPSQIIRARRKVRRWNARYNSTTVDVFGDAALTRLGTTTFGTPLIKNGAGYGIGASVLATDGWDFAPLAGYTFTLPADATVYTVSSTSGTWSSAASTITLTVTPTLTSATLDNDALTITHAAVGVATVDTDGTAWVQLETNISGVTPHAYFTTAAIVQRRHNPRGTLGVRANGITARRLWNGFFSVAPNFFDPADAGGPFACAALRFENPTDADNLWKFVVSNGTTTSTTPLDGSLFPLDAFGVVRPTIEYDGTYWLCSVNGAIIAKVAGASFGPGAATALFMRAQASWVSGANTGKIKFGDMELESE